MTIATKNGSVVLKSGSVAQNCECCGGACCNGTTCSVKPEDQCNAAAGEVFKGVGTTCEACEICPQFGLKSCGLEDRFLFAGSFGDVTNISLNATNPFSGQDLFDTVSAAYRNASFVLSYAKNIFISEWLLVYASDVQHYMSVVTSNNFFPARENYPDEQLFAIGQRTCPPAFAFQSDGWAGAYVSYKMPTFGNPYMADVFIGGASSGLTYRDCEGASVSGLEATGVVSIASGGAGGSLITVGQFRVTYNLSFLPTPLP